MTSYSIKTFWVLIFVLFSINLNATIKYQYLTIADAKKASSITGKNILVSFSARWCLPCQIMDETVYRAPLAEAMINEHYIPVKVDFDSPKDREWFETYGIKCLPTMSILNFEGVVINALEGSMTIAELESVLEAHIQAVNNAEITSIRHTDRMGNGKMIQNGTRNEAPTLISIKKDRLDYNSEKPAVPKAYSISKEIIENSSNKKENESAGINLTPSKLTIQFGAFKSDINALNLINELRTKFGINASLHEEDNGNTLLYKVVENEIVALTDARDLIFRYQKLGVACFLKK